MNIKDLEQQPTMKSLLKSTLEQYHLNMPLKMDYIYLRQDLVGKQYGHVKIVSPIVVASGKKAGHKSVIVTCQGCGQTKWIFYGNLTRGLSKGCQKCSTIPRIVPLWLYKRLTAAKERCTNPNCKEYKNYGARGIKFNFVSVNEACAYIKDTLGIPERSLELDRIDTNGNYEKGNLRFVTRKENVGNRRNTLLSEWNQVYWPYCWNVVSRKLSQGLTREQIIADAQKAVVEKRKCWKLIEARLEFMTYEMPETIIVTPYHHA